MLQQIHAKTLLPQAAAESIINYIVAKNLQPGDRLPSEQQLALQLGVSRGTVREAVKILCARNIIEIKRGVGTYVSSRKGVADDPLGLTLMKDKRKLFQDILEFRLMVEPPIAAMAAKKAAKADIESLKQLCQETQELIEKEENHSAKDIEFHARIAMAGANLLIANILPLISSSIALFISLTKSALKEETILTHRAIVDAISARNESAAYQAMQEHLSCNRKLIEELLEL